MTSEPQVISLPESTEQLKFFVNEEEVVYSYEKTPGQRGFVLTVEKILNSAGFTPASDYELTRDADGQTYGLLSDDVPVAFGEHFTATYKGTTPVS